MTLLLVQTVECRPILSKVSIFCYQPLAYPALSNRPVIKENCLLHMVHSTMQWMEIISDAAF